MMKVRAILAVSGWLIGLGVLSYLSLNNNDMALGALVSIVTAISVFYFDQRAHEIARGV